MAYKCIVVATIPLHSFMASRAEACSCPTIRQAVTLHPRQDFKEHTQYGCTQMPIKRSNSITDLKRGNSINIVLPI